MQKIVPALLLNMQMSEEERLVTRHTIAYTHLSCPVLSYHCPVWVMWPSKRGRDRNSKSRPPHRQGTSGLLAMVMAQPHRNKRTHCNSSSSMHTQRSGTPAKAGPCPKCKLLPLREAYKTLAEAQN